MAAPSEVSDTGSLELCSDRLGSCGDRAINWSPGIEHESCPLVSYRVGKIGRSIIRSLMSPYQSMDLWAPL